MVTQTIQFEAPSLREIGSGTITAELFQGSVSKGTLSAIAEDGTRNGRYTGTVADKPAGDYDLQVRFNGFTISEPDYSVALLLAVGTYVATTVFELLEEIQAKTDNLPANTANTLSTIDTWVKRNAVILSGTIATAGTSSEVFTISSLGITATIAVDEDGNRSSVTWS